MTVAVGTFLDQGVPVPVAGGPWPVGAALVEFSDFTLQSGHIGMIPAEGLTGPADAGSLLVRMRPGTSTKASLVPSQSAGGTNPLYLIRSPKAAAGYVLRGLTVQGTAQGHLYNGVMLDHLPSPQVSDIKIVRVPGDWNSPPGETFGMSDYGCTSARYSNVEVDGAGATAAGFGGNNSIDIGVTDMWVHDCPYSSPTFWQTVGITTTRLRSTNNNLGLNHERCTGTIRHNELRLEVPAKTAQMHLTLNNDQADAADVEIHLAGWAGGHYATTGAPQAGPLCLMINDKYNSVANKQRTLPRLYGPDGTQMQIADAGSQGNPSLGIPPTPPHDVNTAKADPAHWAVRFH